MDKNYLKGLLCADQSEVFRYPLVFPDEQTSEIKGLAEQSVAAWGLPVQGSF